MNQTRTPAGVPAGGQFAPATRPEGSATLTEDFNDERCFACGEDVNLDGFNGLCATCADLSDDHDEGGHTTSRDDCPTCSGVG